MAELFVAEAFDGSTPGTGKGKGGVGEDEAVAVDVDPLVDDFGDGLAGAVAGSESTTLKRQDIG